VGFRAAVERAAGLGIAFGFWRANTKRMLTVILFVAGAACFYVFFKSIDFFEKI